MCVCMQVSRVDGNKMAQNYISADMKEVSKQAMGIVGIRSYQDHSRKQVQRSQSRNIAEEASVANMEMSEEGSSRMCA